MLAIRGEKFLLNIGQTLDSSGFAYKSLGSLGFGIYIFLFIYCLYTS